MPGRETLDYILVLNSAKQIDDIVEKINGDAGEIHNTFATMVENGTLNTDLVTPEIQANVLATIRKINEYAGNLSEYSSVLKKHVESMKYADSSAAAAWAKYEEMTKANS